MRTPTSPSLPTLLPPLLLLVYRAALLDITTAAPRTLEPRLTYEKDGSFQICVFEDLHFGENAWDAWGPEQDFNSVKVIEKVLDSESPQLVVLNGDLITGENSFVDNGSSCLDQIVQPMIDRHLPWASTYGNHDSDFNLSAIATWEREQRYHPDYCRTGRMVFDKNAGVTNYYLPVYSPECGSSGDGYDFAGSECAPELLLWFFDSRGGFEFQQTMRGEATNSSRSRVARPCWVDESVVDWFQTTNDAFVLRNGGNVIPSLAFVHIPPYVSRALQQEGVIDASGNPGINDDYPLATQGQGWCAGETVTNRSSENCAYGGQDVPFMRAISSTPGLLALFSGHDHGDTWCYRWDRLVPGTTVVGTGVSLCFGQHSGYGGYGNWIRGARQIKVWRGHNATVRTWIRLESGKTVGYVTLNDTFNQDRYPATPDDMTHCSTCNYSVATPHSNEKDKVTRANAASERPSRAKWVIGDL